MSCVICLVGDIILVKYEKKPEMQCSINIGYMQKSILGVRKLSFMISILGWRLQKENYMVIIVGSTSIRPFMGYLIGGIN